MVAFNDMLACLVSHPICLVLGCSCIYWTGLIIYRLFFHPLAKYPGPKLAAATLWYEFFYDAIQCGQYTFKIKQMHEEYGPIVRISPEELHVNDPKFIDQLYVAGGKKRDKYDFSASQFGIPHSVFGTVSHDHHRLRRGAMNRFFSKASVTKLEPVIRDAVSKLCQQLETYAGGNEPAKLNNAFSCMTTDIVTEYAFDQSSNFLESATFEPNFHDAIVAGSNMGPFMKQFPWILPAMNMLPDSWVTKMNPEMGVYLRFQQGMRKQIREIQEENKSFTKPTRTDATIFHELLNGNLPEFEKRVERLWQEGQIIVGAGTETTAWTLSATMFYILANQTIRDRLYDEVKSVFLDAETLPSVAQLEKLPYLSAVVCEGLRLSYGVSTRLQRVAHEPLHFNSGSGPAGAGPGQTSYAIPPGTPVGMTSTLIHLNEDLFPNPHRFDPERWLDENGQRSKKLEGYLLGFSKGSRQCLGINLANAEVYLGLATLVNKFGDRLQLFETDESDVEIKYDRFVPCPKLDTQGIRVLVKSSA